MLILWYGGTECSGRGMAYETKPKQAETETKQRSFWGGQGPYGWNKNRNEKKTRTKPTMNQFNIHINICLKLTKNEIQLITWYWCI